MHHTDKFTTWSGNRLACCSGWLVCLSGGRSVGLLVYVVIKFTYMILLVHRFFVVTILTYIGTKEIELGGSPMFDSNLGDSSRAPSWIRDSSSLNIPNQSLVSTNLTYVNKQKKRFGLGDCKPRLKWCIPFVCPLHMFYPFLRPPKNIIRWCAPPKKEYIHVSH